MSGYYIRCSHEHYRCHKVYVTSTRHIRTFQTVFFKHKYLTQPTFTSHDALIVAADKLADAISGAMPQNSTTENGIKLLLDIFKQQANIAKDRLDAKAKRLNDAANQRVQDKRNKETATPPANPATAQRVPAATTTWAAVNDLLPPNQAELLRALIFQLPSDNCSVLTAVCSGNTFAPAFSARPK